MDLSSVDVDSFFSTPVTWWDAVLAIAAIVGGWIAARYGKRGMIALLQRLPNLPPGLIVFAARFTQYVILLLGIGVALAVLGANVQPLLAIVLIVGLVVVLVLRGVADNFAAGVLIQTRQSVRPGEELMVEGPDGDAIVGTVTELNSRSVILTTVDGRTVHVPNAQLVGSTLVNHSRHGARRSEVQVRVDTSAQADGSPRVDADEVLSVLVAAAAGTPGVDADRVRALVSSLSPQRVTARLQFWHDPARAVPVSSDVVRATWAALTAAGWTATVTSSPGMPPVIPPDPV
ncbi:mechanosensitive ion channel family protein [Microbacterium sp.]|uniref:mechanosensitive ion channel family protein n=1 Tax=Microbacterium sp. TaxID=51671 RepID=UPI003C762C07